MERKNQDQSDQRHQDQDDQGHPDQGAQSHQGHQDQSDHQNHLQMIQGVLLQVTLNLIDLGPDQKKINRQ